jgi:hypothetical protein
LNNFDDFINELMGTVSRVVEKYGLSQNPNEESQGYAERVRLRMRLANMAVLMHGMALDMAALDGIAEEARRVGARNECVKAAKKLISDLSEQKEEDVVMPVAPDTEEEERAKSGMAAIGVMPTDEMTYAEYSRMLAGQEAFHSFGADRDIEGNAVV